MQGSYQILSYRDFLVAKAVTMTGFRIRVHIHILKLIMYLVHPHKMCVILKQLSVTCCVNTIEFKGWHCAIEMAYNAYPISAHTLAIRQKLHIIKNKLKYA